MSTTLKGAVAERRGLFDRSALWIVAIAFLQLACTTENRDVSALGPYSAMIGRTYKTVGEVGAFGIYVRGSGRNPTFVALYPTEHRPTGPEVVSSRPVQPGTTFRVVSASIFDKPIGDTVFYTIQMETEVAGESVPVQVRLRNHNAEGDFELNPRYYEHIK